MSDQVYSMPEQPAGVTRVRATDDSGRSFTLTEDGGYAGLWQGSNGGIYTWGEMLALTDVEEIPLSAYDAAVTWWTENPGGLYSDTPSASEWTRAVLIVERVIGLS